MSYEDGSQDIVRPFKAYLVGESGSADYLRRLMGGFRPMTTDSGMDRIEATYYVNTDNAFFRGVIDGALSLLLTDIQEGLLLNQVVTSRTTDNKSVDLIEIHQLPKASDTADATIPEVPFMRFFIRRRPEENVEGVARVVLGIEVGHKQPNSPTRRINFQPQGV